MSQGLATRLKSDGRDDSPVIDLTCIQEAADGDIEFEDELIEMFAEDMPDLLDDFSASCNQLDAPSMIRHAHSLKGVAGNMGAVSLSAAAKIAEQFAREGNLDAAAARVEHMRTEINAATVFFADYQAKR